MIKENKSLFITLALSTFFIGMMLIAIVYFIFGERAAYFFAVVFAIPIGAVCSLLVMMIYKSLLSNKD